MSATKKIKGACLCGVVRITANQASSDVGACHCGSCRRWGGGPLLEVDCGTDVEFVGADNIAIYNSSDWAERGFCRECGTHLFYRLKDSQQHIIPVGLLDDDAERSFKTQVFIDAKPAYYQFANKTEDLTGAELFAKFAPPQDGS